MRKSVFVGLTVLLVCLWAVASPKESSWDGWISDSKCAAKGANAGHAACAKKCVENGEKPVFVADKDQKVVGFENPAAVTDHVGEHVKITGTMTNSGTLHVDKVSAVPQS